MDDIQRIEDDEGVEWVRVVEDEDLRGVGAHTLGEGPWKWQIFVSVAEFLREDPLESEMREGVDAALRSVAGVTEVAEEDREVWIVQGEPTGPDLVRAVATVVDALADRAEAHLDSL